MKKGRRRPHAEEGGAERLKSSIGLAGQQDDEGGGGGGGRVVLRGGWAKGEGAVGGAEGRSQG